MPEEIASFSFGKVTGLLRCVGLLGLCLNSVDARYMSKVWG
jgi:hypothetical protein